jgi:hypothetical protein
VILRRRERHAEPEQSRGLLDVHGLAEVCNEILMSLLG